MGVGYGLHIYDADNLGILWYDVVVKRSRSLSHLVMSSCYFGVFHVCANWWKSINTCDSECARRRGRRTHGLVLLADVNLRSRSLYAIGRPSVVCLSSVCLWRWCTLLRRLNFSAIFCHHTIAQGLYFSGAKNRWWGTPLSPWNLRSKWPTPLSNSAISTNIGS